MFIDRAGGGGERGTVTRLKMFDCRHITDPPTALLCAVFVQAIADTTSRKQEIRADAQQWLQGTGAAEWLVELDICPEAAMERLK